MTHHDPTGPYGYVPNPNTLLRTVRNNRALARLKADRAESTIFLDESRLNSPAEVDSFIGKLADAVYTRGVADQVSQLLATEAAS